MQERSEKFRGSRDPSPVPGGVVLGSALVSGAWLEVMLGLAVEPLDGRNPRLAALGLPGSLAVAAGSVACLVAGTLVLRAVLGADFGKAGSPGRRMRWGLLGLAVCGVGVGFGFALGSMSGLVAGMIAVGAVFYVAVGRFIPPVGVITLALLVTLSMALPNPRLTFALPLALMLLHMTVAGASHHYFTARRPRLRAGDWVGIVAGWVFWTLGLGVLAAARSEETGGGATTYVKELMRWAWVWPGLLFMFYIISTAGVVKLRRARRLRSRWLIGLTCGFMVAYNAAWLAGIGRWGEAVLVGLLVLPMGAAGAWVGWLGTAGSAAAAGDQRRT